MVDSYSLFGHKHRSSQISHRPSDAAAGYRDHLTVMMPVSQTDFSCDISIHRGDLEVGKIQNLQIIARTQFLFTGCAAIDPVVSGEEGILLFQVLGELPVTEGGF